MEQTYVWKIILYTNCVICCCTLVFFLVPAFKTIPNAQIPELVSNVQVPELARVILDIGVKSAVLSWGLLWVGVVSTYFRLLFTQSKIRGLYGMLVVFLYCTAFVESIVFLLNYAQEPGIQWQELSSWDKASIIIIIAHGAHALFLVNLYYPDDKE